jgi:hypothetical protein
MDQVLKLALLPRKATHRQRRAAEMAVPAIEEWRERMTKQ